MYEQKRDMKIGEKKQQNKTTTKQKTNQNKKILAKDNLETNHNFDLKDSQM